MVNKALFEFGYLIVWYNIWNSVNKIARLLFREECAQESFELRGGKLHIEELCILFPFTIYRELSIELQAKFTLWVVPPESEEGPTLLLQGEHEDVTELRVFC